MIRLALSAFTASTAQWATILTGLFAYYNGTEVELSAYSYGGGFHFSGIQVLGVVAVITRLRSP